VGEKGVDIWAFSGNCGRNALHAALVTLVLVASDASPARPALRVNRRMPGLLSTRQGSAIDNLAYLR
jgi:hypothetical protein